MNYSKTRISTSLSTTQDLHRSFLFYKKGSLAQYYNFLNTFTIPVSKCSQDVHSKVVSSNVLRMHVHGERKAPHAPEAVINLCK